MTAGVRDFAFIVQRCYALLYDTVVVLFGMNAKQDHLFPSLVEAFHIKGMQRGGAGARIDFGFEARYRQLGQVNPFAPA